jgi:hypothetical protein
MYAICFSDIRQLKRSDPIANTPPNRSLIFYIAYEARYASRPNNFSIASRTYTDYIRPLITFQVFVIALDRIARIATFIVVTQLAVTLASGRRTLLRILQIVIFASLAILFVLTIAFRGRYADLRLHSAITTNFVGPNFVWVTRYSDVDVAFFTVYLVGVLVALVAAIALPSVSPFQCTRDPATSTNRQVVSKLTSLRTVVASRRSLPAANHQHLRSRISRRARELIQQLHNQELPVRLQHLRHLLQC